MGHKIFVNNIQLYAYHGCLEEEGKIGSAYTVDIEIDTNFTEAAIADDLNKTVDYVTVYNIAKEEMAIRAKLIETVAKRIGDRLKLECGKGNHYHIKVTKINPPMNGNVRSVSVLLTV
jgi:7,8-dihydroneopterin aldolase/epimerase/oxygenase